MNTIIFTIYLVLVIGFSYYYRVRSSGADANFFVAKRRLNTLDVAFSSVAAVVNPFTILLAFGMAALFGPAGYGLYIAFFVAYAIAAVFAGKFYTKMSASNSLTLTDYIRNTLGPWSEKTYAAITVLYMVGAVVGSFVINVQLLEIFLGMERLLATVVSFGIVVVYLLISGYKGVIKTGVIQLAIVGVLLLVAVFAIPSTTSFTSTVDLGAWFSGPFWVIVPVFFFVNIANPSMWQSLIGAKSEKVARNGLLWGAALLTVLIMPIVWISFSVTAALPDADPNNILFDAIGPVISQNMAPFIFVGLYAAMMSTLDTSLFYSASNITKNLLPKRWQKKPIQTTRVLVVLLSIITVILSLSVSSFIDFIMNLAPLIGVLAGPFILSIFIRLSDKASTVAMIVGTIVFAYLFINPPTNYQWFLAPAFVSIGIVIVSLIWKKVKN